MTFEDDEEALKLVLAEWSSDNSLSARVNNLKGTGSSTRFNSNVYLNSATVLDDGATDTLMGSSGQDWFLGTLGQDIFKDKKRDDLIN